MSQTSKPKKEKKPKKGTSNQQKEKKKLEKKKPKKQEPKTERPRRTKYEQMLNALPPERQQAHLRAWLAGIVEFLERRRRGE